MELSAAAELLYQQGTAAKGRTSLSPPMPAANRVLRPHPHLGLRQCGSLTWKKAGSFCHFCAGDRLCQGEHPWGAGPGHSSGPGWAGGLRGSGLVPEGSAGDGSAPAHGITAPHG